MPEFQINYLADGVAALATIFIGVFWYSPRGGEGGESNAFREINLPSKNNIETNA